MRDEGRFCLEIAKVLSSAACPVELYRGEHRDDPDDVCVRLNDGEIIAIGKMILQRQGDSVVCSDTGQGRVVCRLIIQLA